jgi:anaerobic selenocysteine-containing dehydrogenase
VTAREVRESACPLDCPDACSLAVTVEDGRVVALDGDRRNPLTDGFICGKVRRFARHMYGEHRLQWPLVRTGKKGEGRFERASWDRALGLVAARLDAIRREHGGEAILPLRYGGSNGLLTDDVVDARLWHRLGASRLLRTLCAAPSGRAAEGLYGRMPGVSPAEYVHAALVVLWGVNPSVTGIHLVPPIHEARRRGATLVVVDPRRTPLAKSADLHLAVRPGSDVVVALALHRFLFTEGRADLAFLAAHATGVDALRERAMPWTLARAAAESGIEEGALRRFAELYAQSSPAVIRCGWGVERNRNGGSAVAAILALPAVGGKLGVRGGGYTMSNSRALRIDPALARAATPPPVREINMNRAGEALCTADPPIRALFVYDCNPLQTLPNQLRVREGLSREDLFTVVLDAVMTDTARHADVVLPATTFLEHDELRASYGAIVVQRSRPVVAPVGEARTNAAVFAELLARLGLARDDDASEPDALVDAIVRGSPDADALARGLATGDVVAPAPDPRPVQMVDARPRTADGKIHLFPPELDAEAPLGLYGYQPDPATAAHPLALLSPATSRTVSSTFGQLHRSQVALALHPEDARTRGIADGDAVRVWNAVGELRCRATLSDELRPGVAVLPKGLWSHHTLDGNSANAVTPDALTDLGGGAVFNDARVQVERVRSE